MGKGDEFTDIQCSLCRFSDAVSEGDGDGGGGTIDVEFAIDAADDIVERMAVDAEVVHDLFAHEALSHELQDRSFPVS